MNTGIMNQDMQMLGELFKLRDFDEEELNSEKKLIKNKSKGLLKRIKEVEQ